MDQSDTPIGQRFSHVYIPRGFPLPDGPRMRVRLAALLKRLDEMHPAYGRAVLTRLKGELGVPIPIDYDQVHWDSFYGKSELRDALDAITIYHKGLLFNESGSAKYFTREVARIFKEENVRYVVDEECGVHFAIDAEYENNMASTVAGLGNPRHTTARQAFDAAQSALDRAEPDLKEALRNIFEAVEVVFKLILPEARRISSRDITEKLKPLMSKMYPGSTTAVTVAGQYLDSLGDWVNSVHNYRHGQPLEEAPQPPLDLSVALMSSGVAYLRWLIGIDQALQGQAK